MKKKTKSIVPRGNAVIVTTEATISITSTVTTKDQRRDLHVHINKNVLFFPIYFL